jgi:SAM-dependent methyltransferase
MDNHRMRPEDLWNRRDVVATYTGRRHITSAEVRVIAECWPQIAGGRVLDIGVGTGRTIPYLAPFAHRYVGVDFMPNMVAEARRNHPGHDIRQADARELPFADGELSFALFSFNGIDCVEPTERPKILREVHRVLAPGGVFAYSAHNLDALTSPRTRFTPDIPQLAPAQPLRSAVRVARSVRANVRGYRNFRRNTQLQQFGDELVFIMDGAHDYGMMVCYATQSHERRALAETGFTVRSVIEPSGHDATALSRARNFYFISERT